VEQIELQSWGQVANLIPFPLFPCLWQMTATATYNGDSSMNNTRDKKQAQGRRQDMVKGES